MSKPLIFCALDTADLDRACALAQSVGPVTGALKLGLEFFSSHGPEGVKKVMAQAPGAALFLDLKFHDIPNTVAAAIKTVTRELRPAYVNVHAAGGAEMMIAAREACESGTKLLAVTVLTSLDDDALDQAGQKMPVAEYVQHLALLTKECGLGGVVCSAREIAPLRRACGEEFTLMVPGIRPEGSDHADQKRVMTPIQAIHEGATHLVIGRPVTGAADPAAAARGIIAGLAP